MLNWLVNCINIGGHVLLLTGPTFHSLNSAFVYISPRGHYIYVIVESVQDFWKRLKRTRQICTIPLFGFYYHLVEVSYDVHCDFLHRAKMNHMLVILVINFQHFTP